MWCTIVQKSRRSCCRQWQRFFKKVAMNLTSKSLCTKSKRSTKTDVDNISHTSCGYSSAYIWLLRFLITICVVPEHVICDVDTYKLSLKIFQTAQGLTFKVFEILFYYVEHTLFQLYHFYCLIDLPSSPLYFNVNIYKKTSFNIFEDFSVEDIMARKLFCVRSSKAIPSPSPYMKCISIISTWFMIKLNVTQACTILLFTLRISANIKCGCCKFCSLCILETRRFFKSHHRTKYF